MVLYFVRLYRWLTVKKFKRNCCYQAFLLILLLISSDIYGVSFANKDVEIISSNSTEFHCKVKINFDNLDWFINSDSLVTYYKTIQIGIPYNSKPRITVAQGGSLLPVKTQRRLSLQSYPLVKLSQPLTVRGRQLVNLQIFPVVSENYYQNVEIKVVFDGGEKVSGVPFPDPVFGRIFKSTLANYKQFKTWSYPQRTASKSTATKAGPFEGTSPWYKIDVNITGLYKITGAQLEAAGLSLDNLNSNDIHLYNGGGLPLEVLNEKPRPVFTELSILVEDGGDGIFNHDDYILFYGESQNRWVYPVGGVIKYINNPYTDRNVYWLNISNNHSGLRMGNINATPSGMEDTTITTYKRYIHVEQDNMLRLFNDGEIFDYYTWYWSDKPQMTFFVSTPGIIASDTADIKLVGKTLDTTGSLDDVGYMDLFINNVKGLEKNCNQFGCTYRSASLIDGANQIRLDLWTNGNVAPYFDYMNLWYDAENLPLNDKLDLTIGGYSGLAKMEVINNFKASPMILDISTPLNPTLLTGTIENSNAITFQSNLTASRYNRFYLCLESNALSPISIQSVSPTNLYTTFEQADLIVVTSAAFTPALQDYVDYRSSQGYRIKVVNVDDIMDNFSFGLYDPTAIRDFLKFAYENYPSPPPSAVLFVGDGTYDYLDHLSTGVKNIVPPYIHPYDESSSDDNYVFFGAYGILDSDTSYSPTDRGVDMLAARWSVKSTAEIAVIVDKIKRYESLSDYGIWRDEITLVADDEYGAFNNEIFHTTQTEQLAKYHIPPYFLRDKIYLMDYPFVNNKKPAVNDAIVKAINDGTLLINYVGHGNPNLWAHEHVFTRQGDLPRLNNFDRLPLVFTASCAIGFFDDPAREGMAEDLLAMSNGGAIAVIAPTRLVYSSDNAAFNRKVFDILLYDDSLSMCEAFYAAKLQRQYQGNYPIPQKNDRKYLYFGGPFVKLGMPRMQIIVDSAPDSLMALEKTQVRGHIIDKQSNLYNHNGELVVNVYDSQREKIHRLIDNNGVVTNEVRYNVTGPTIYRGSAGIKDGEFDFDFIPPLDIGYGGQGAKIALYAIFDTTDAVGIVDSINVADSIATFSDTLGPSIDVSFVGLNNFSSGDFIKKDEQMLIELSDLSGINITGGLGHGISLEIDNKSENVINLTNLFKYQKDDYTQGSLLYQLENLKPGNHHFKIKAWDNANNSAKYEFDAEVLSTEKLAIKKLLNYPNPMKDSTQFSFELTKQVEKFSLEIFTLSGRKIKSFVRYSLNPGYYDDIKWYGRDFVGDRVATEVYIYKATAYPVNGEAKVESFGKIVVIN